MTKEDVLNYIEKEIARCDRGFTNQGEYLNQGCKAGLLMGLSLIKQIDEPKWHTEEPTEEGEYIIEFLSGSHALAYLEYREDFGELRFVYRENYSNDDRYMMVEHLVKTTSVVAWQKIEPYKEQV